MFELGNILEPIDYENLQCENLCELKMEQGFIDYFSTFKSVREILNGSKTSSDQLNNGSQKPNEIITTTTTTSTMTTAITTDQVLQELSNDQSNRIVLSNCKFESISPNQHFSSEPSPMYNEDDADENNLSRSHDNNNNSNSHSNSNNNKQSLTNKVPLIEVFKSQKMKDICPLIVAPGKLNVPAIKLPLTAQSQVSLKRTGLHSVYGSFEFSNTMSRKRVKRGNE